MKDLEGRKAMIQVGSGEVFEVDSPRYSDEGAMMFVPHAEGEKEQWTQCSLVSVVKVAGADGVYPADPSEEAAAKGGKGDESELVAALREALAAKGDDAETVKALREEVESLKKLVAGTAGETGIEQKVTKETKGPDKVSDKVK